MEDEQLVGVGLTVGEVVGAPSPNLEMKGVLQVVNGEFFERIEVRHESVVVGPCAPYSPQTMPRA